MRPPFPIYNSAYLVLPNSINFTNGLLGQTFDSSYFKNLFLCELCEWGLLATIPRKRVFRGFNSTLFGRVYRVVAVGSKKEVDRITARSIVAGVADKKSIRDFSPSQLESHPVGASGSADILYLSVSSAMANGKFPRPTLVKSTMDGGVKWP
jgi:hypothetical protein